MGCSFIIIYCDIKSSNILFIDKYVVKVVDFGFLRLGLEELFGVIYVLIVVKGIVGYLDLE